MVAKQLLVILCFTFNIVPGYFYCVNHPDVCPKHREASHYCGCCGKALYMPMMESRISDQKPYTHIYADNDRSEEFEDFQSHRFPVQFYDESKELPTDKLAKHRNIDFGILNIGDEIKTFEDFADTSSEEVIVGNKSRNSWKSSPVLNPQYLPDVLATSNMGPSTTSESVLDIPPSIPEREMSGLPVEARDIGNLEIEEFSVSKVPEIILEKVASRPNAEEEFFGKIKLEELTDLSASKESSESTISPIPMASTVVPNVTEKAIDSNDIKKGDEERRKPKHNKSTEKRKRSNKHDKRSKRDREESREVDEKNTRKNTKTVNRIGEKVFNDILAAMN